MMVCCGENIENYHELSVPERNSVDLITAIARGRESALISVFKDNQDEEKNIFEQKKLLKELSKSGFDTYLLRGVWKYCDEEGSASGNCRENFEDMLFITSSAEDDEQTKIRELAENIRSYDESGQPFLLINRAGVIFIVLQDGKRYLAAESVSAEAIAKSWWKVRQRANHCFRLQGILSPRNDEAAEIFERNGIKYIG